MSSPQLCHCGQRSLSRKVVSLDFQQQCSWLNQKPMRHRPSFMSVSQWAAMSMPPASAPDPARESPEKEGKKKADFYSVSNAKPGPFYPSTPAFSVRWYCGFRES